MNFYNKYSLALRTIVNKLDYRYVTKYRHKAAYFSANSVFQMQTMEIILMYTHLVWWYLYFQIIILC